jgi:hypothetical protein
MGWFSRAKAKVKTWKFRKPLKEIGGAILEGENPGRAVGDYAKSVIVDNVGREKVIKRLLEAEKLLKQDRILRAEQELMQARGVVEQLAPEWVKVIDRIREIVKMIDDSYFIRARIAVAELIAEIEKGTV